MLQEIRPELHLMVLWENARSHEQEILADVPQHLTILRVFDIGWTPERVVENYTRFYGVKLDSAAGKAAECGSGRFLLLVLRDEHPRYELAETSRGNEWLNINLFRLKNKYRALMGGKSMLHATNTVQETNHDAALLLGLNYEDLAAAYTTPWDGCVSFMDRDITGAGGWESLSCLFYTLNATVPYVVLRNEEILPDEFTGELHGDIDLLTDNFPNLVLLTGGVPKFPELYRVHHAVRIADRDVMFDFRFVGDDYYCRDFEQHLLNYRILNDKGIYVAQDEDALHALIYHVLVHKKQIADDYSGKIYKRFEKLGLSARYNPAGYASPFDLYYKLLRDFMQRRNYHFTRPKDASVFFCGRTTEIEEVGKEFERRYGWRNITPVHCESLGHGSNLFLSAEEPNGQGRIFIKHGKSGGIYKNEYQRAKELYTLAPQNVVEPLYWHDSRDFHFAAARWTEGETLEDLLENGTLTAEQKAAFLEDILSIFLALQQSDIVHRDLIPRNLLYTGGHLKLIDFQFAVSKSRYEELKFFCIPKRYKALCSLGRLPDERRCIWDDAYALQRIILSIGSEPAYAARYEEILNQVSAAIGKHAVAHPDRDAIIAYVEQQEKQQQNSAPLSAQEAKLKRQEEKLLLQKKKIDALAEKLSLRTEKLVKLREVASKQTEKLKKLAGTVAKQTAKIEKLTGAVAKQTGKIEKLSETSARQTEKLQQQKQRLERQAEQLQTRNEKIQQQSLRLQKLKDVQEKLTAQIERLSHKNTLLAAFKKQTEEAPRSKYCGTVWRRIRYFNGTSEYYLFGIKIRTKQPQ